MNITETTIVNPLPLRALPLLFHLSFIFLQQKREENGKRTNREDEKAEWIENSFLYLFWDLQGIKVWSYERWESFFSKTTKFLISSNHSTFLW